MVLQSGHATIWGFTEGNENAITANIGCIMKDGVEYQESQTLTPEKVIMHVICDSSYMYSFSMVVFLGRQ